MKGFTEMLTMFIKIIEIGFLVLVIFGTFLTISSFNIATSLKNEERAAKLIGEAALGSSCLAVAAPDGQPIWGLMDKAKLQAEAARNPYNPSCMPHSRSILLMLMGAKDNIMIGNTSLQYGAIFNTTFPAAIQQPDGNVTLATMAVFIGDVA